MKWYSAFFVLLFSVLLSSPSIADDDDDEFCGVISNQGFKVSFEIEAPDSLRSSISLLGKTLYVSTTDRSNIKPFWSMVDNDAFVKVDELTIRDEFEAKLTYTPIKSNKGFTGEVSYKYRLNEDDPWIVVKKPFNVDLSEFNNGKIIFFALDDDSNATAPYSVEEVSCEQTTRTIPKQPPSDIKMCDYFSQPAQSWVGSHSSLIINNQKVGSSSPSYFIGGWTEEYVTDNLQSGSGKLKTPFDTVTTWESNSCEVGECSDGADDYKIAAPPPIDLDFRSTRTEVINYSDWQNSCNSTSDGCIAKEEPAGSGNVTIELLSDFKSLTINGDTTHRMKVIFPANKQLNIEHFVVNSGLVDVVLSDNGVYGFKSYIAHSSGELEIKKQVQLMIVTTFNNTHIEKIKQSDNPDDFFIYAPDATIAFGLTDKNAIFELYATILAHSVNFQDNIQVHGAVTTLNLTMSGVESAIIGQSGCFNPIEDIQLVITPSSGTGLACDGIAIDFSLVDQDGIPVEGKGQELVVTSDAISGNKNACWSENGQITTPDCNHASDSSFTASFSSGAPAIITRYIHSKFLSAYNIDAQVSEENLSTPAGPYTFIAQSLSLIPSEGVNGSDNNQVASRPFPFRLKLRGKENGNGNGNQLNCRIIEESRDIDVHFSHVKSPQTSSQIFKISQDHGNTWQNANTDLLISFVDGVAGGDANGADGSLLAKFDDAGIVDFTASGAHKGNSLTSTERFYFRPFTASVCAEIGTLPSNIEEVTGAYLAAGTDFNGYLKAVNWIATLDSDNNGYGNGVPDRFEPSLICAQAATPSYITHNGYGANLSLNHDLTYPSGGQLGELTADGAPVTGFSKEVTNVTKNLPTIFNWNEVGTLNIDAFQHNYFNRSGFNIPSTTVNIGRFYPAYFDITETEWDYPENQGSATGKYVYMDQNFTDVDFEVAAYSSLGTQTENYGLFDDSLKASFSLVGEHANRLNITDIDLNASHWNSGALWHVNNLDHAVIWSKNEITAIASNRTTKEDGPFNMSGNSNSVTTALGLKISGVDPVSFDTTPVIPAVTEQELLSQPDVRYGRMVLDSVGTAVGQSVTIPLRVEYWNGNSFVISDTDNATTFNGVHYCKQTIWPDPSSSSGSSLSGSNLNGIDSGVDRSNLEAIADSSNSDLREQVRFWLKLTDDEASSNCSSGSPADEQPWLQYNWRGQGDEDPSTVVTFGIYRGNDRVIFRGESNIIGTSN